MAVKRKASSSCAGAAKKQKQCAAIREALLSAECFPLKVRQMVSTNLLDCLVVAKEERHHVQEEVIDMIGQILKSRQDTLQKSIDEAEAKLGSANTEKLSREQAKDTTASEIASKTEARTNEKNTLTASVEAVSTASLALTTAETEQINGDNELAEAHGKKEKLEAAWRDSYMPLKEGGVEADVQKTAIAALVVLGKDLQLDSSLMTSLGSALIKAESDRGTFDQMVLETLGDELNKIIKHLQDVVASGEGAKAERAAKVEATKSEKESAEASAASSRERLEQCNVDLGAARAAHKAAATALSQLGADMKNVNKELATAQAELAAFRNGALASYDELVKFTSIQPPTATADADVERPQ